MEAIIIAFFAGAVALVGGCFGYCNSEQEDPIERRVGEREDN